MLPWQTWRRRFFVLSLRRGRYVLRYFLEQGGRLRGEISLEGGSVEHVADTMFGRRNVACLQVPNRALYFAADTEAELHEWVRALRAAAAGRDPALETRRSIAGGPRESISLGFHGEAPSPPLPGELDIDGPPEVGTEMRVRAEGNLLDSLCVAWFRWRGEGAFPSYADVRHEPGVELIPHATRQTYTVQEGDVGMRIGCVVQPASGEKSTAAVTEEPVHAVDLSVVSVRIRLKPHVHHKFCDRRSRVCTATGRYREGEILDSHLRGPEEEFGRYRIRWFRSDPVDWDQLASLAPSSRPSSPAADADTASGAADADVPVPGDHSSESSGDAKPWRLPSELLQHLQYHEVEAKSVSQLAPTPAAHESSPPIEETLKPPAPPEVPPRGRFQYPLFLEDVDCMIRCELVPLKDDGTDDDSGDVIPSLPVGPVEPAPPKIREIWLEGACMEGCRVVGRRFYYGGVEGESRVWWIRVNADGASETAKGPLSLDSSRPFPSIMSLEPDEEDSHPCAYRLGPDDVGALLKFKCEPQREDGDQGYVETSRPSDPVAPYDAECVRDKIERAAAVAPSRVLEE